MTQIITTPDAVSLYLKDVEKLADNQKDEFGFIPYSAYEESCFKGNLFVATSKNQQGENLFAGYVLLGGRFPTKRIFQVAVPREFRRKGVGKKLVDAVVNDTEKNKFYKIIIKVGAGLFANKFWEEMQFSVVNTQKGGSLHPIVNVRVREIIPSLFSVTAQPSSALQSAASQISSGPTLYLLDTNILLDISKKRPDSEASKNLLRLVKKGDINVALAEETIEELRKHSQQDDDLALNTAYDLPIFPLNNEKNLIAKLKKVMFPSKNNISQRDISDIKHIATAISNNATGLITRDKSILKKNKILQSEFSLEVLSPIDFWGEDEVSELEAIKFDSVVEQESIFISLELTNDVHEKIEEIFPTHEIDKDKFEYAYLQKNGVLTALCAIEKRFPLAGRAKDAFLFLLDNSSKANASLMLDYISKKSLPDSKETAINLSIPRNSEQIADLLIERGYNKTQSRTYKKICAGHVIGKKNWKEKKEAIKQLSSISLPDVPPNYQGFNQEISIGEKRNPRLYELENFLSAILILPERGGAIIPIKRVYADAFFGHSRQLTMLLYPEARLSEYKSYFGTHRAASRLSIGKLLFFYESQTQQGQGEVIAFARIVRSNIANRNRLDRESRRCGVLDDTDFKKLTSTDKVLETVFTHSVNFPTPVSLRKLHEIGCNDKANFVTSFSINHQQVCSILHEGGIL